MVLFQAVLLGRVGIKKNNKRIFARGRRVIAIPSEKYQNWARESSLQLLRAKAQTLTKMPITTPINLSCSFHFPNHQGEADLSNLYQGIEDLLQDLGIIENDKQVYSHNNSCKIFGSDKFYTEVIITHFEP